MFANANCARSSNWEWKWHCRNADAAADIEGGKALQLAANIGLGIGIAGAVGGALLIAFGGPVAARPAAETSRTPNLALGRL